MAELLTAAEMRAAERAAIDSGAVTGLVLMERAGRGVVEAVLDWRPELARTAHRAVVLCGPGNNGGDGFVVARLLAERGWTVEVFLFGDAAKLPPDAAENCRRWREMGEIRAYSDAQTAWEPGRRDPVDLFVDALFGTGLSRPLAGVDQFAAFTERAVLDARSQKDRRTWPETTVVAIDVPSGLCADAGRYLESGTRPGRHVPVMAHLTVTFHTLKTGHVLEEAPQRCGTVVVVDIGLPAGRPANGVRSARIDVGALGKGLPHKYSYGHALVLSGGVGHGGAARLAARGALRVGAGLVTVGAPPAALIENAAQLNAVMLKRVADPEVLGTVLEDARINALCLGPGMGVTARTREMVLTALGSGRSCVLDADALTVFAEAPEVLFDALHADCVLTPHGGEFARLFPDIAATLAAPATSGPAYSKVDATRAAAARAGCVVLYKGADTVIAGPEGRCAINAAQDARAAPWLATAGSGDVLAGFIAGLLARGSDPFEAAETAAWLHVACARSFGPGLIAEDLPEQIPQVFKALGLS